MALVQQSWQRAKPSKHSGNIFGLKIGCRRPQHWPAHSGSKRINATRTEWNDPKTRVSRCVPTLYWLLNFLFTYWFISEVLPTLHHA